MTTKGPTRTPAEQAHLEAALFELFDQRITFNQVLGLKLASVQPDDVRATFEMRPQLVGHQLTGRLHGGVISATLDVVGGLALMVGIAERHPQDNTQQWLHRIAKIGTVDLRVDFLRQGIGREFTATAQVSRLGGRVGATQMRLVNEEGTLIATGNGVYVVS